MAPGSDAKSLIVVERLNIYTEMRSQTRRVVDEGVQAVIEASGLRVE